MINLGIGNDTIELKHFPVLNPGINKNTPQYDLGQLDIEDRSLK